MHLRADLLVLVAGGQKSVEIRLADDKRNRIRPGDLIIFTAHDGTHPTVTVTVRGIRRYSTPEGLIATEDPQAITGRPASASSVLGTLWDIYGDRIYGTEVLALSISLGLTGEHPEA